MAFDATKPNTSQQIGDVITSTRDNDVALKAQIDAHQADSTAHGLPSLVATQADYVAHKADSTTAHGLATTNAGVLALQTEMGAARGSQSTLATRLASALNGDGSIRLSTLNNKWINNADVPTYINATSFSVPGDKISYYIAGAQLRFTISGSYAYAPVASRSFSGGVTTVVIDPAYPVLTGGLSNVDMALIAWDNAVANSCTQNASNIANVQGQVTSLKVEQIEDWQPGKPAAGATVKRFVAFRAFSIPSGVTNAKANAGTAATASAVFNLQKNGATFGTMTFAADGTVPTWAAATATSFAAGDVFSIVAPASQDATLADIAYYIPGVLP